jgi:hypothetical protein
LYYEKGAAEITFLTAPFVRFEIRKGDSEMKRYYLWGTAALLATALLSGCKTTQPKSAVKEVTAGDAMQRIGQAEYVTILPQNLRYRARIDSGATTCSISALDIEQFERDGKKWVRFRFPLPTDGKTEGKIKKSDIQEYPLTREVPIKRHGAPDQIRPAVKLHIQLGKFDGPVEFTLTDRTKYEYPVLIGRNMLDGHAIVDVSESYIAEKE